jgi:hypothetical protein
MRAKVPPLASAAGHGLDKCNQSLGFMAASGASLPQAARRVNRPRAVLDPGCVKTRDWPAIARAVIRARVLGMVPAKFRESSPASI